MNLINQLGEWNPQLFRELKGRLKLRNLAVAGTISLFGQLLLILWFLERLPAPGISQDRYCTGGKPQYYYRTYQCLADSFGHPEINWQLWWTDIFIWLSAIAIFTLLVVGTYMLIGDQDREERRGTLNFIRLSPQSTGNLLVGKLLGVPILLYFVGLLAIPLHLWSGLNAEIPLIQISVLYGVVFASLAFFYSGALLFGLVSSWMGGFQAWLGSGIVLVFLLCTTAMRILDNPVDLMNLLSPTTVLPYLVPDQFIESVRIFGHDAETLLSHLQDWRWYQWSIGGELATAAVMVLSYGLGTVWIWQALNRCFRNPHATTFSKGQSYWLVGCFEVAIVGFAPLYGSVSDFSESLNWLMSLNLILFIGLMAALSPGRQVCIDWARYRHISESGRQGLWKDLMWGEKSPAVGAIAFNLIEANAILLPWILLSQTTADKFSAIGCLLLSTSIIFLYASIAQLMLLMKTPKRGLWASSTVGATLILPPLIFLVFSIYPERGMWLFTAFPWEALKSTSLMTVFSTFVTQLSAACLFNWQLTRQLRKAGESASKALTAGQTV